MYEIIISKRAEDQLKKLSEQSRILIGQTIERIKIRPLKYVKRLTNSKYYRVRTGAYRIIIDIKPDALIITVIDINHRKNIYN